MINPEVRALEAARTYAELDHARERLDPLLRKKFDDKGYVLMGWGDVGPVHIFSQRPDSARSTICGRPSCGCSATIRSSSRRSTRSGCTACRWACPRCCRRWPRAPSTRSSARRCRRWRCSGRRTRKYVTSAVIGMATGATVMTKKAWDEIEPRDQQIIIEEAKAMEVDVTKQVREDNTKAFEQLQKKNGLQVVRRRSRCSATWPSACWRSPTRRTRSSRKSFRSR